MPLGSSSEAPVIRPGPRTPSSRGLVGSTTGLGPASDDWSATGCSISKLMTSRPVSGMLAQQHDQDDERDRDSDEPEQNGHGFLLSCESGMVEWMRRLFSS